ncbi:MAG: DUF4105 domain-containing protein [Flavobacteriales bacterium]
MKRALTLLLCLLVWVSGLTAQTVPFPPDPDGPRRAFSDAAKASVLTCSPGRQLYSAFGHTAIRVTDLAADPPLDKVFNYGTFQFSDGFYVRFVQGELIYSLSTSTYGGFLDEYIRSGRGVEEQRLDLDAEDIAELYAYLQANAHPDHRDYRYLFLYDNCATRVITVLKDVFGPRLTVDCPDRRDSTYRDLLRAKLGGIPLTRFGIDLVLGLPVDASLGRCGDAFLPDHLAVDLEGMVLDAHSMEERPLVRSSETVLPSMLPQAPDKAGWPVLAGWVVLVICLVEWSMGKRWLRRVLPLITGCVGLLLTFLWFGTDHADTRFNLNILWAFPLHLLGAGLQPGAPKWRRQLARFMGMAAAGTALLGLAPPHVSQQAFHPAVLPLGFAVLLCFEPWKRPAST